MGLQNSQPLRCNDLDLYILRQVAQRKRLNIPTLLAPIIAEFGAKKSTIYWRITQLCKKGLLEAKTLTGTPPKKELKLSDLGNRYLQKVGLPQNRQNCFSGEFLWHKTAVLKMIATYETGGNFTALDNLIDANERWAAEFIEMCHNIILTGYEEIKTELSSGQNAQSPHSLKRVMEIIKEILSML